MEDRQYYLEKAKIVLNEVRNAVVGKDEAICKVMMAILASGHVLLEDIPGVGKTTMASAFALALGLESNRVQFTPDVMPSDLMGFNMYNKMTNQFEYRQGAAMCNILLADEINRTSPKTQSALLQIMEERAVSVDGNTYALPNPFFVIATQNPFGSIGTQRLPESQLDRFMIRLSLGYPTLEDEISIMKYKQDANAVRVPCKCVIEDGDLEGMKAATNSVYIEDDIFSYAAKIVKATREKSSINQGASPRGSIALISMAKAEAFLRGHDYVLPSDVQNVAIDVLSHRVVMKADARHGSEAQKAVISEIINEVKAPSIRKN